MDEATESTCMDLAHLGVNLARLHKLQELRIKMQRLRDTAESMGVSKEVQAAITLAIRELHNDAADCL
jgi:hypothetical protein